MSLSKKLEKLSNKIDFYSNLLSKKTEKINDIHIKDKTKKIAKWNKCKMKLIKQIKNIDSNFNKFIKDSNNCISELKHTNKSNLNKMRFGVNSEEYVPEEAIPVVRRRFLSDYEDDDSDEENDDSDEENDEVRRRLFTDSDNENPDTAIIYRSSEFTNKVNKEVNINVRLYNCLLYGTFFQYKYSEEYDKYTMRVFNERLNETKTITDSFLTSLKNNNAYLAGGYINMAVNYPSFNNEITDLDIYVNKRNFINLYNDINNIGKILHTKFNISSPYMESFFKKNGLLSRVVIWMQPRITLDILIVRDDYDLKDVIKNFDLTYCSVYLDPENLGPENVLIKGNIDDMMNKSGKLNDDYAKEYLFNKFIMNRIKKYKYRGYKTKIKTNIDIVIEEEKEKVITKSTLVHVLINRLFSKYSTVIDKENLIYSLSMLNYTIPNLIDCAKNIANMIYKDKRYYYYILIDICNYRTTSYDEENLKFRPKFLIILNMLNDFVKKLTNEAEERNELIFTKTPEDTLKIIKLLTEYDANESTIFHDQFPNDDINVKTLLMIIKQSFDLNNSLKDRLINLSKQNNPKLLFHEILMKSGDDFLSDVKYINTIMVIFAKVYFVRYYETLFKYKWFMRKKPREAILYNLRNFKNAISKYNNGIEFREIMYYDLYEAEEKPYDEVYEDSDNLIFILEDVKTGFVFTFETLTTEDFMIFILECTQDVLGAPILDQIENRNLWYVQLGAPYNIGISLAQLYQAYSIYENSDKKIREFVISSPRQLGHISNINAIQWNSFDYGRNIWGEEINLVSESHCGIGMKVYDKVMYKQSNYEE